MDLLEIYLQSQIHKVISQDMMSGMLNHAYLINSKDTYLLSQFSRFVAKEIFCVGDHAPCDKCVNCDKVNHSNMVDLNIYPRTEKNLMVDDVNEIVNDCFIRPMESKYKVYILERFDECTIQAQNKILKTLEEPPYNVVFILTSSNESAVLPTITSRSKKITEPQLNRDLIEKYLSNKKVNNARLLASMSDGSLTIANKLVENNSAVDIVSIAFDLLKNLKTSADILRFSSKIVSLKKDFNFFLDTLISIFRDIMVYGVSDNIIFSDNISDYEILSKIYNKDMVLKIIEKITIIPNKLNFNCNLTGIVDQMLLDILEVKFLWQK